MLLAISSEELARAIEYVATPVVALMYWSHKFELGPYPRIPEAPV
jgi:hypothetical protein